MRRGSRIATSAVAAGAIIAGGGAAVANFAHPVAAAKPVVRPASLARGAPVNLALLQAQATANRVQVEAMNRAIARVQSRIGGEVRRQAGVARAAAAQAAAGQAATSAVPAWTPALAQTYTHPTSPAKARHPLTSHQPAPQPPAHTTTGAASATSDAGAQSEPAPSTTPPPAPTSAPPADPSPSDDGVGGGTDD